jgi:hypothetical protein
MTTVHEILIAAIVSLLAFSAATAILLGDATAAPPYAGGPCPDIAKALPHLPSGICANASDLTKRA